jgi:hypothetical protein
MSRVDLRVLVRNPEAGKSLVEAMYSLQAKCNFFW